MPNIQPEQLLAEIEDVLRSMPERSSIYEDLPENHSWLGRASAAVSMWNPVKAATFDQWMAYVHGQSAFAANQAMKGMITMLHSAQHDLRLRSVGPLTTAMGQGNVFDYFDEVRKVVETAATDLLFVDPYLDAEFVSRYLPHISPSVAIRLLAGAKLQSLLPAVDLLRKQNGLNIEVRSATSFHDRYVFVDGSACYQSGASFKDGAKKAPTTLTQIVDAFQAIHSTYEQMWTTGSPHP